MEPARKRAGIEIRPPRRPTATSGAAADLVGLLRASCLLVACCLFRVGLEGDCISSHYQNVRVSTKTYEMDDHSFYLLPLITSTVKNRNRKFQDTPSSAAPAMTCRLLCAWRCARAALPPTAPHPPASIITPDHPHHPVDAARCTAMINNGAVGEFSAGDNQSPATK